MARLENSEIAALFAEMGDLLQIDGGDRHRVAAFRRAARIIITAAPTVQAARTRPINAITVGVNSMFLSYAC